MSNKPFKPMKAGNYETQAQRFPVLASPKIDGFRCVIRDGKALAYSQKAFPNPYTQKLFGHPALNGLDGELVVGPANAHDVVQRTAETMRRTGEPDVHFHVFDDFTHLGKTTVERQIYLQERIRTLEYYYGYTDWMQRIHYVTQTVLASPEELDDYEQRALTHGYEGVMLRDPESMYKFGRSTTKEGTLIKVKRFMDAEAVIVGVSPAMHNMNEAVTNALGRTERSSAKAGLTPLDMIGTIHVRDAQGREFDIGPGKMTHIMREALWNVRESLVGKIVTFKYFPHGEKDVPRHGSFLRFRDPIDMA